MIDVYLRNLLMGLLLITAPNLIYIYQTVSSRLSNIIYNQTYCMTDYKITLLTQYNSWKSTFKINGNGLLSQTTI